METVNIQCPSCKQPYSVATADLHSDITEFSCQKCNIDFCCGPVDANESFVPTFLKSDLEMEQPDPLKDAIPDIHNTAPDHNTVPDNISNNIPQDNNLDEKTATDRVEISDNKAPPSYDQGQNSDDKQEVSHNTKNEPSLTDQPVAKESSEEIKSALNEKLSLDNFNLDEFGAKPSQENNVKPPEAPKPPLAESNKLKAGDIEKSNCPRCGKQNVGDLVSCRFCGVVFAKYKKYMEEKNKVKKDPVQDFVEKKVAPKLPDTPKIPDSQISTSKIDENKNKDGSQAGDEGEVTHIYIPKQGMEVSEELETLWENVKANYDNDKEHKRFIQICLTQDKLAFASGQYRKILDANPNDDIANKMVNNIVGLAMASYVPSPAENMPIFRLGTSGAFAAFGLVGVLLGLLPDVPRAVLPIGIMLFTIAAGIRVIKR